MAPTGRTFADLTIRQLLARLTRGAMALSVIILCVTLAGSYGSLSLIKQDLLFPKQFPEASHRTDRLLLLSNDVVTVSDRWE